MRIAIVKLSALGDIVHAMVVLQFIKRAIPQCRIDWIVEENFADALKNNPHIDTVLPVNLKALKKDKLKFFSELSKVRHYAENRYDVVIDMQGLVKSAVVSRILGPNAGFDKNSIREKAAAWFYRKSFFIPYEENVIVRNMDIAAASLGLVFENKALESKEPFLFFSDVDKVKTANLLKKDQKNIIHILGSSWQSKIYPQERFVEVIDSLEGNHLLVWGSDTEYAYAQYIARNSDAQVLPRLDLNELKALVASADLVIGGDSGPTHFAWALNRPSITIFGPTPSKRNVLETKINRVIDCGKVIDPLKLDKKDMCIHTIDPEKIVALAEELLA